MNFRSIAFLALVPLLAHADSSRIPHHWTQPAYTRASNAALAAAAAAATTPASRLGTTATASAAMTVATAAATTTQAAGTRNVYIAIRTDNITGNGSATNPFDGSTQVKFDAALAHLWTLGTSTPIVLHLAAGVYTVTPVSQVATAANPLGYQSNVPGNLTIIGAGESKTTVRAGIARLSYSTYWVFEQMGASGGASFEDLTIDCNMENQVQTNVTINGVFSAAYGGANMTTSALRIHVINGGQPPNLPGCSEWFGIEILDGRTGAVAQARNCLVDHYQGVAGCTSINASTYIANNTVILNNNDPYNFAHAGGGTGGFQNAYSPCRHVLNNVCHNCTFGIYSDVDNPNGIDIENNWFDVGYGGVFIFNSGSNATLTNVTINKNVIQHSYFFAITLGTRGTTAVNSNFTITNNTLETRDIAGASDSIFAIDATRNCVISNNVVSTSTHNNFAPPVPGAFDYSELGTFTWSNNRYSPGSTIPVPAGMKD